MKQAIEIVKTLGGIATGLVCAVALLGAGFTCGVCGAFWAIHENAKSDYSTKRSYGHYYSEEP